MKTAASILLTILLTVLVPITALVYRVDTYVLQPEPLLRAAEQNAVYTGLIPALADTYLTEDALKEAGLDLLPREQAVTIASATVGEEWLRQTATQLVTEFYRLRNPGTTLGDLQLTVQLADPKDRFLEALSTATLPTDNNEFNPVLLAAVVPSQINLLHAFVPEYAQTSIQPDNDPIGLKKLSSELTPDERAALIEQAPEQLPQAQNIITRVHAVIPGALAICAILFAAIIVLNVTSKRHVLRWVAAASFFPGVVLLAMGLVDDMLIMPQIDAKLEQIPSGMHTLVRSFASGYVSQFFDVFMIAGITAIGIAIASVVIAVVEKEIKQHHKPHAPHSA